MDTKERERLREIGWKKINKLHVDGKRPSANDIADVMIAEATTSCDKNFEKKESEYRKMLFRYKQEALDCDKKWRDEIDEKITARHELIENLKKNIGFDTIEGTENFVRMMFENVVLCAFIDDKDEYEKLFMEFKKTLRLFIKTASTGAEEIEDGK